jgi:hypothetical protein
VLPQFRTSLGIGESIPDDFDEDFLNCLQCIMLAQAQECAWQKAMMG